MLIASVIADVPTQSLDRAYSYVVPQELEGDYECQVGSCVVVPLGARSVIGFVIDIQDYPDDSLPEGIDPQKLKPIKAVVSNPYFDEEGAACAQWLSERYIAPLSACIRLFTPPGGVPRMVRSGKGEWTLTKPTVSEVDDRWVALTPEAESFEPRKNAVKQIQILEALKNGELRVAELTAEFGSIGSVLSALQKKGVIRIEHRRRLRGDDAAAVVPYAKPVLTDEQQVALRAIADANAKANGSVVLLDGVTGSGKTEVYLQAIEEVLAQGRTACVLVPEISLTPQTVARFRGRFGDRVAVMHSRMSAGERYDQWDFIRSGEARVVVGARSALFTPLKNLGLIVIDEEHEGTYKQESAPRYHARDVALYLAKRAGATVVLGSATPSIESLHAAHFDPDWNHVVLSKRANGRPMPPITVIDMAKEFSSGSRAMFSGALSSALHETLESGHKAVLMLNQRGFAKFLLCRDCGFVPTCPSCSTSLTYHERGNELVCHYCGFKESAPAACPECESPYLRKFGAGTQRVEDELRLLIESFEFPFEVPIIRMDADTTTHKGDHRKLLETFGAADAAVLLGTQMIAKGLDFKDVTLVGVINADTQLNLPDFRAAERTFDLVQQVAGRAGRAHLDGQVMVQTYRADAPSIMSAAAYDRAAFLRTELPLRKALAYPPYASLANVLIWGEDENAVAEGAQILQEQISRSVSEQGGDDWSVFPASPCVLSKLRNVYRWHIQIKAPAGSDIATVLLPLMRARKASNEYSVAVDISPQNLL